MSGAKKSGKPSPHTAPARKAGVLISVDGTIDEVARAALASAREEEEAAKFKRRKPDLPIKR